MTTQPPRSYTRLAIAIIVAALIIGSSAYLIASQNGKTTTITTTSTSTPTTTVTFFAETAATTATCTIVGPGSGALVQITDRSRPVTDATIAVLDECGGDQPGIAGSYTLTTNSSGWVGPLCTGGVGLCVLTITAFGYSYPLSIPMNPGLTSVVNFDLFSGNVTVTYCSNLSCA